MIEKSGIPVAAVVSMNDLQQLQLLAEQREQAFADVPDEELDREITKAVAEARAELRAEREQAQPKV